MTWYWAGQSFSVGDAEALVASGVVGFVYQITNLKDGRKYIGQKKFLSRRSKKPLKGKKRRRITVVDSDWQDYWGSNKELQKDIEILGKENFSRVILYLAPSKAMMNYVELYHQVVTHSLLEPTRYYNEYVGGRISRKQLEKFCNDSLFDRHQDSDVAGPPLYSRSGV